MPSLKQRFFVDSSGKYLGSWCGFEHPNGEIEEHHPKDAIEIYSPPDDGRDVWDFNASAWIPYQKEKL